MYVGNHKQGGEMNKDIVVANVSSDALDKQTAWIAKRDTIVAEADKIQAVETDAALEKSGWLQAQVSSLIKELGKARLALTRPLDAVKADIMAREKEMTATLETQFTRIKRLNDAYATKKYEAAEAERKRIEKIERERAEHEANEERKREEAARAEAERKRAEAQSLFGAAAVVDAAPVPPPVQAAPVFTPSIIPQATAPHTSSNSFVEIWEFEVTDANQVPRIFLSVDEKKLRDFIQFQKTSKRQIEEVSIPGVRVFKRINTQAKRSFG